MAVKGFVDSFRKNVKYGDDLLALCDELEVFAERLRKRADELKSEASNSTSPSTNNNPNSSKPEEAEIRKEAEDYLALLETLYHGLNSLLQPSLCRHAHRMRSSCC